MPDFKYSMKLKFTQSLRKERQYQREWLSFEQYCYSYNRNGKQIIITINVVLIITFFKFRSRI